MKNSFTKFYAFVLLLGFVTCVQAQTTQTDSFEVTPFDSTITALIENSLIGDYVSALNIYSNIELPSNSIGVFSNLIIFDLDYGFVMSTGDVTDIQDPVGYNASTSIQDQNSPITDIDLVDATGGLTIHDAVVIEFDYIPFTNVLSFSYVFGSEEFPEYATGTYNDVFGFFVSGPGLSGPYSNNAVNIALIPGTENAVTISEIYQQGVGEYYIDNEYENLPMVFDGLTPVLDAIVDVIPFQTYHIKLAIGDVGDGAFDSAVFLKDNSFSSWPLQYFVNSATVPNRSTSSNEIAVEGDEIQIDIELPAIAQTNINYNYSVYGSAESGVDYEALSGSVSFDAGDLTSSIVINTLEDNELEGVEDIMIVMDMLNDTIVVSLDDNTTRVNTISDEKTFSFYPNPTKEKLNINYSDFIGSYELKIFSADGKLVLDQIVTETTIAVDVSSLPEGTYSIQIGEHIDKFVKQ